MTTWTCLNVRQARAEQCCYIFRSPERRYAVADHSIRTMLDPASCDDGLLLLDTTRPVEIGLREIVVPVARMNDLTPCIVTFPAKSAPWLLPILGEAVMELMTTRETREFIEAVLTAGVHANLMDKILGKTAA